MSDADADATVDAETETDANTDRREEPEGRGDTQTGSEGDVETGTEVETDQDDDSQADPFVTPEAETRAEVTPETAESTGDADGMSGAADDTVEAATEINSYSDAILSVRGLDAGYGDLQILTDVDLDVQEGEYVTIVGPNGAGKSTVMKSVFSITDLMGGMVEFEGDDITGSQPEDIIHLGLGYVPQSDNVFSSLSVIENLEMGAYILDEIPESRLQDVFSRFPILEERKQQKAGTLSGGQQQMLAMGRALMLDPDLLLLDEPSAGLAPDLVDEMFDRIDAINASGTAILMVEQNAKEALQRCDRGYVFVSGQNRYEDDGSKLLNDPQVRQDFLGG